MKKIFLICPVREVTEEEMAKIRAYVEKLEASGQPVYWPYRDTDQKDSRGTRICRDNRQAIKDSKAVHIWWNGKSVGSIFDFGMTFAFEKPVVLVNENDVSETPGKSFNNVLHDLNNQ